MSRSPPGRRDVGGVIKSMVRRRVPAQNKQTSSFLAALGFEIVSVCPYITVDLIKRSKHDRPSVASVRQTGCYAPLNVRNLLTAPDPFLDLQRRVFSKVKRTKASSFEQTSIRIRGEDS